jgi:DHA1 family bicyclomycin/chloramphenicol resistance-like MFS transporter
LLLFVLFTGLGCVAAVLWQGKPPLLVFAGLLAAIQFLMCLTMPNFNAIAMEPLGAVAGTASSVLGLVTTLGGALIGMVVGRTFDGTVLPLGITYIVSGLIALLAVLWATRWRLNLSGVR